MESRIIRTRRAQADLAAIWRYIARDSVAAADDLSSELDDALRRLAAAPHIGRPREELAAGLRSFALRPYTLYYRVLGNGIELIRVLHGARDIQSDSFDSKAAHE